MTGIVEEFADDMTILLIEKILGVIALTRRQDLRRGDECFEDVGSEGWTISREEISGDEMVVDRRGR